MYERPTPARFAVVDADNPLFWQLFVFFTFEKIRDGFAHYGVEAVINRVRWETARAIDDDSGFKINNNWKAFYARKFHRLYPEHDGFFRTRFSIADMDEEDGGGVLIWT
jgi:hypothetical protein